MVCTHIRRNFRNFRTNSSIRARGGGGSAGCSVAYTTTAQWNGGFNGQVTVTAGSTPITGWTTTVTVTPPQRVSAACNGSPARDGSGNVMTMRPSHNGSPAAGASTTFGFTVMTNGNTAPPVLGACTAS
ncbi:cellulose binding domain-containing protein [Streptomyces sp. CA-252508]|uniref:cellulose binding domain-containing protein n=1 Tax=Streptomyces sp. CA-252508 TaxID=3418946 RepID=UPI003D94F1E4